MYQPIGSMLDQLGVTANLDEHERITDVVVLGKVAKLDASEGATRIVVSFSTNTDWITRLGLLYAGRKVIDGDMEEVEEGDG